MGVVSNGVTNIDNNRIFGRIDSDIVSLLIYPPRQLVQQVVRPYRYNFAPDLPDKLVSSDPHRVLEYRRADASTLNAVLPDSEATAVNMDDISGRWTFVMILDNKERVGSELIGGGRRNRSIMAGYFLHPPLNETTLYSSHPTVNPNAIMIFTHTDNIEARITGYGPVGGIEPLVVKSSNDLLHQAMGGLYKTEMGLCDVSDIAISNNVNTYNQSFMRSGMPITLSEMSSGAEHVPNMLNNPHGHLTRITEAADATASQYRDSGITSDSMLSELGMSAEASPYRQATNVMLGTLQKGRLDYGYASVINPTVPTTISDLEAVFGNRLHIYPSKQEMPPQMDVRDPWSMTVENIIGYMVANSISSYCHELGISMVQFKYSSWVTSNTFVPNAPIGGNKDGWQLDNIALYATSVVNDPTSGEVWQTQWSRLKYILESAVFPIIKHHMNGSDFVLVAHYAGVMDTALSLNSLDNGVIRPEFSIHHNRLGGMINPNLGTFDAVHSNTQQVNTLMNQVVNEVIGQNAPNHMDQYRIMDNALMTVPSNRVDYYDDDDDLGVEGELI